MTIDYREYPILYVDDEASNLVALRYSLEDQFTVLTTQHAEDALRILADQQIAVLLADQRMPGMSGAEVCARARQIRPEAVRIIITAYADMHAAIDAINRGQVTRYLAKPYRPEELIDVLKTAIDLVHLQETVRDLEVRLLRSGPSHAVQSAYAEIAHEINNPLGSISAAVRQASDMARAAIPLAREDARVSPLVNGALEALADAQEGVDQLTAMVTRLRRGLSGAVIGKRPRCDAARAVDSAVRLLRPELQRKARVQTVIEGAPVVPMDASALGQVLINLLLNASQALAESPETKGEITVRVDASASDARIVVADNGPGIAPDVLQRIFDPHYTTKPDGSGLGLAIAQKLVTDAGGRIEVESTAGAGATFTIRLPLTTP